MTEKEKRNMLQSVINGDEWECRENMTSEFDEPSYTDWKPYKLGEAIHDDWQYRKALTCYIYESLAGKLSLHMNSHIKSNLVFTGSESECIKWILDHTYCVVKHNKKFKIVKARVLNPLEENPNREIPLSCDKLFEGTKTACERFIKENAKQMYRPFKNGTELIETYNDRFYGNKNRDFITENGIFRQELPLIWIVDNEHPANKFLITEIYNDGIAGSWCSHKSFDLLFSQYTFLDGSPIGVEVDEC